MKYSFVYNFNFAYTLRHVLILFLQLYNSFNEIYLFMLIIFFTKLRLHYISRSESEIFNSNFKKKCCGPSWVSMMQAWDCSHDGWVELVDGQIELLDSTHLTTLHLYNNLVHWQQYIECIWNARMLYFSSHNLNL